MPVKVNNSSNVNDSWGINKTPRHIIEKQRDFYEQNREAELEKSRARYWEHLKEKKAYDKRYYKWRKSWGDYDSGNFQWNLLRISGDVFSY